MKRKIDPKAKLTKINGVLYWECNGAVIKYNEARDMIEKAKRELSDEKLLTEKDLFKEEQ